MTELDALLAPYGIKINYGPPMFESDDLIYAQMAKYYGGMLPSDVRERATAHDVGLFLHQVKQEEQQSKRMSR